MKRSCCVCKVCGRKFIYGDCQSPMLNSNIWDRIVKFYDLSEYEKDACFKFNEHYKKSGSRLSYKEDEHLYLCYRCMEHALGRKIKRSDLIGKNIPLNDEFEYMYF